MKIIRLQKLLLQKPYTPVLLLLLAISLAGCSRQVRVDGEWQADASRDQSFKRVLVLGVLDNAGQRCDFEMFLETQLKRSGAEAKASCYLMDITAPITLEGVQAAVEEFQADAVLSTVLVGSAVDEREGGDRESRGGLYLKRTGMGYENYYRGGYGGYSVPVVYGEFREAPVVTTVEGAVRIQSMLYATSDRSLVYVVNTTATDLHARDAALAAITPPIAERLQRAGLIP